jgi:hypothetical protein
MSIETTLYATLANNATVAALVSTRIYPVPAPEQTAFPYLTYFNVAGSRISTLPGVGDGVRKRIQINCNAETYAGSKALGSAVIGALEGNGYLDLEFDLYDPTTQVFTLVIDWSFMD